MMKGYLQTYNTRSGYHCYWIQVSPRVLQRLCAQWNTALFVHSEILEFRYRLTCYRDYVRCETLHSTVCVCWNSYRSQGPGNVTTSRKILDLLLEVGIHAPNYRSSKLKKQAQKSVWWQLIISTACKWESIWTSVERGVHHGKYQSNPAKLQGFRSWLAKHPGSQID